jgi:hypothetical protein
MFCQICGLENTEGLNYCKRCGAGLTQQLREPEHRVDWGKLTGMFWAVAVFGFLSIGMLVSAMIVFGVVGAREEVIMPTMIFGSAAIITIAVMLIKQLSKLVDLARGETRRPTIKERIPDRYSQPQPPAQLPAKPRSFSSVTENTTRNFEQPPVYRDPGARE